MRTFTSSSGDFVVTAPDLDAFVQERNVLIVKRIGGSTLKEITLTGELGGGDYLHVGESTAFSTTYTMPTNEPLLIDISEILRTYYEGDTRVFTIAGNGTVDIDFDIIGLINPKHLAIPVSSQLQNAIEAGHAPIAPQSAIYPPSKMLNIISVNVPSITCEVWHILQDYSGYVFSYYVGDEFLRASIVELQDGSNVCIDGNNFPCASYVIISKYVNKEHKEYDIIYRGIVEPLLCGHEYVEISWVSASGNKKIHTFEVLSHSFKVDNVSLEPHTVDGVPSRFKSTKQRSDTIRLGIDSVTAYDLWYYSDVLASPLVQLWNGSEFVRVDVGTSNVTVQRKADGDAYNFEFELKLYDYDAIAL